MKKILIAPILAASLLFVALDAKVQTQPIRHNPNEININFKDLKIKDFIKMVAKITNKNILISKNIKGTVDYVSVKPIKKDQIFNLLVNVLDAKGFTVRDTGDGFLKVISSADAPKSAPPSYGHSSISEVQTVVIPVKNLNVRTILRQVNFLLSRYGKIALSYENNSVVITDYPDNIKTIKNLINKLDHEKNSKVQFVILKNAQAKSVLPKIKSISNSMFDSKIDTQKVSIIDDEATNAIILSGNADNINQLIPLIRRMDKQNETVDKRIDIIHVKNADAAEIVKTLQKLLSDKSFAKTPIKKEQRRTVTTHIPQDVKNGKVPAPIVKTETITPSIVSNGNDKPTVTVDVELNAIVVYATEREIKEIRNVINQLDTERMQVYVKAKILEISNNKATQLGAKYGLAAGFVSGAGLYGISGELGGSLGPVTSMQSLLGSSFVIPKLQKALGLGMTISLFTNNGAANILSEPSILCINNKESSIYVGRTESILSQTSIAATTTALPTQSYTREDIGLTLKVKPRISADNKVSLEIKTILEDIVPNGKESSSQPTTTKREVETTSIVTNGETVIIGGLVKNKDTKQVVKIPLLGDIPIIGIPFRHTVDTKDKTNLVIMLTPYIVKKSEDLSELREALGKLDLLEKNLAIEFEENYQNNKDFFKNKEPIEMTHPEVTIVERRLNVEEPLVYGSDYESIPSSSITVDQMPDVLPIIEEIEQVQQIEEVSTIEPYSNTNQLQDRISIEIDEAGDTYQVTYDEEGREIGRKFLSRGALIEDDDIIKHLK